MRKAPARAVIAAFLSALAVSRAGAYGHSFTNAGANPVELKASHFDCGEDTMLVAPGQTVTWRSGLCCLEALEAGAPKAKPVKTRGKKKAPPPEPVVPPMKAAIGAPVCGDSSWKTGSGDGAAIVRN